MRSTRRSRDGSPYRFGSSLRPAAYDRFYNVVANPTLWFIQHYCGGLPYAPDLDCGCTTRGRRLPPGERGVRRRRVDELEREPAAAVFFHDYHLYLAPTLVRALSPTRYAALHPHPVAGPGLLVVLPPSSAARSTKACSRTTSSAFTRSGGSGTSCAACADILGAEVDVEASTVVYRGRTTLVTSHPIGVDPAEFDELRDDDAVLEQERLIASARPEFLVVRVDRTDPSKNIVRGFRAFALFLEQHPELHGRVAMLALLDPSRQDVPEYSDYLAAIEREAAPSTTASAGRLAAVDLAGRRQLRAVGRRVQAVRRAARERRLRRAQPRLEGGAARERARRRADPLRERRRRTRSSASGRSP